MGDHDPTSQIYYKIDREKALINAAVAMRASSNPQVQASLDAQIKEGRKNLTYLEERLKELEMRRLNQGMEGMNMGQGGPPPPQHGSQGGRNNSFAPNVPPKSGYDQSGYGAPAQGGGYMDQLGGGSGQMPAKGPYGPPGPGSGMPKARPNYSKLGRANYSLTCTDRLTSI